MTDKDLKFGNIAAAQKDMREGYGYGSVGVFVSGIIWALSSFTVHYHSSQKGTWTLIIGGMLIFPAATLIGKLIGIKASHHKDNPLGKLAMEGTIWMIMCVALAYGLSLSKPEWFFQGMLMIIGGRYLTFASIYGLRLYWLLGAVLAIAAYILFRIQAGSFLSALAGGCIEIIPGLVIYGLYRNDKQKTVNASAF